MVAFTSSRWVHQICALFNNQRNVSEDTAYLCPRCVVSRMKVKQAREIESYVLAKNMNKQEMTTAKSCYAGSCDSGVSSSPNPAAGKVDALPAPLSYNSLVECSKDCGGRDVVKAEAVAVDVENNTLISTTSVRMDPKIQSNSDDADHKNIFPSSISDTMPTNGILNTRNFPGENTKASTICEKDSHGAVLQSPLNSEALPILSEKGVHIKPQNDNLKRGRECSSEEQIPKKVCKADARTCLRSENNENSKIDASPPPKKSAWLGPKELPRNTLSDFLEEQVKL